MCGIVAMLARDARVYRPTLGAATEALRHRGPEGTRAWVSEDGRVGLGHTRLAIIDLTAEQPIASEDGRVRIVVNGEFYGFETIRRDLEGKGHHFRTRTDSEIALHLWEDEGARCLERLRGEFAFVVWDEHRRTLFAARDRFGIKPLFYAEAGGTLYLASEAKALFAAGIVPGWDRESLFHTLHVCPLEDRSLFAGIRQVPPGHTLTATDGSTRVERYWDMGASGGRVFRSAGSCIRQVGELLEETVRMRLRADVPVGCLLSGGIDSSTVLGMAAAHSAQPVAAFTIAFDHREYDESAAAAETVRHTGAEHHIVAVPDAELADYFSDAVWHGEMIQYNSHGAARYLLSRAIRRAGYKTVLGGEGADELFIGYAFLRAALPGNGSGGAVGRWLTRVLRALRSPRRAFPHIAATSPWLARIGTVLDLPETLLGGLEAGLGLLRPALSPAFLEAHGDRDVYRSIYAHCDAEAGISGWEPVDQLRYLWFHSIFPNYHLAADRVDMAHGVEVRLPFLDHRLVEYVNAMPLSVLAEGPEEKFLLREAARPFLPRSVRHRAKQPFWAPPSASREGSRLHELTQDTLRSDRVASIPFLAEAGVKRLLDGAERLGTVERRVLDPLLTMVVSVCILDEAMHRPPPAAPPGADGCDGRHTLG